MIVKVLYGTPEENERLARLLADAVAASGAKLTTNEVISLNAPGPQPSFHEGAWFGVAWLKGYVSAKDGAAWNGDGWVATAPELNGA